MSVIQSRALQTLSVRNQRGTILGFISQPLSIKTTQLSLCRANTAIDNMYINECGCVPVKFYLQKQTAGWTWPKRVVH